jgi:CBS domain-containing protein
VVTLARLMRVPPGRTGDRIHSVAVPLPDDYLAAPEDPAAPLAARMPLAGTVLAVVVADRRVVGMVTTDDLGRLVQQSRLRSKYAPRRPTEPASGPPVRPEDRSSS